MGSRRAFPACTVVWAAGSLLIAGDAAAQALGAADTPAGASFASACAGLGFAGGGNPGDNVERIFEGASATCQAKTSAVGASASTSASASGSSGGVLFSNAAQGSVGTKTIHLKATNSGSQQAGFPGGETNAGFSAEITIPTPAGVTGTTGIWVIPIQVHGLMSAIGKGADGTVAMAAFVGGQFVQPYSNTAFPGTTNQTAYDKFVALDSPLYRGAGTGSVGDYEEVVWRVADYGPGDSSTLQTQMFTDTIDFAVAVTYGTPFDLGIFAQASAGEISSGPVNIANTTTVDFSNTISWGGPGYIVTDGGSGPAITNFTILSNNGADYNTPAVPEPATWAVMVLGALGVGAALRRERAAPSRA